MHCSLLNARMQHVKRRNRPPAVCQSSIFTKMYSAHLTIPFVTEREADIVYNVLRVDEEPPRSLVKKHMHVEKKSLIVDVIAPEPRQLRVALTSLFDHLILVVETIKQFGPPVTQQYSHYDDN